MSDSHPTTTLPAGAEAPSLSRGDTLGRFMVLGSLGAGGMGVVVSAYDPQLDRRVAVKLLRGDLWSGERAAAGRESLLREAQAMARLNHPNVVAVYEVAITHEGGYVVMEQVDGQTLRAWLEEKQRGWQENVDVIVQAGAGLAAAHRAGVVHRDFKPDNVLVGHDGRPRVSDFGLALAAADVVPGAGTRAYMAPEQAAGATLDARADQYAFCVTLWEALHGERPQTPPVPPRDTSVPAWIDRAIARGLSPRVEDRYPSMEALLRALQRDPGRTVRRGVLMGGAAVAVAAAAYLVASLRGPSCDASLAEVWGGSSRAKLRAAFAATGSPRAEDTFVRVAGSLDRWTQAWIEGSQAACRARAEPLADRRATCLEELRIQLRATVGVIVQNVTADRLGSAALAVAALGEVEACSDPRALAGSEPRPSDPSLQARAAALQLRVQELRILDLLLEGGKVGDLAPLLPEIHAFPVAHVRFHALVSYAAMLRNGGDFGEARQVLEEVIRGASAARDDTELTLAWVELLDVLAWQKRWDEILTLSLAAEAAIRRVEISPRNTGQVYYAKARAHHASGDREVAEVEAVWALAFLETAPGSAPYQHHKVVEVLANLLFERGDTSAAIEFTQRRIRDLAAAYGPDHYATGTARLRLAEMLLRRGDAAAAEASARAGVEAIQEKAGHHALGHAVAVWSETLERLGRLDEARAHFDEAVRLADVPGEERGPRMLLPGILDRYGRFLIRRGELAGAREKIVGAKALREQMFGRDSAALGESLLSEGDLLLAENHREAALASYREGAARFPRRDVRRMRALLGQAETLLSLARAREALEALDRAKALGVVDPHCDTLYTQAAAQASRAGPAAQRKGSGTAPGPAPAAAGSETTPRQ